MTDLTEAELAFAIAFWGGDGSEILMDDNHARVRAGLEAAKISQPVILKASQIQLRELQEKLRRAEALGHEQERLRLIGERRAAELLARKEEEWQRLFARRETQKRHRQRAKLHRPSKSGVAVSIPMGGMCCGRQRD